MISSMVFFMVVSVISGFIGYNYGIYRGYIFGVSDGSLSVAKTLKKVLTSQEFLDIEEKIKNEFKNKQLY